MAQSAHAKPGKDEGAFNMWFGQISAAGTLLHFNDEGSPYRFSLGAGRPFFLNDLSVMANLVYSYYNVNEVADKNPSPDVKGGNSHSLGLDLLLRWTFLKKPHASYYVEAGSGFQTMQSGPPFPADGSDENFTVLLGPGVLVPTGVANRLRFSLQWFHISNANLFPNNSGYDGLQLTVGLEWAL
jgi:hypothetical protein